MNCFNPRTTSLIAGTILTSLLRGIFVSGAGLLPSYDYIVVGGGVSGMAIANRLSDVRSTNVLVIEAGPLDDYDKFVMIPRFYNGNVHHQYDWNVSTTPQEELGGQAVDYTQGKAIGGGSIVNAMAFDRGSPADYDAWVSLGNPGWGWDDLLPYFKKSETFTPAGAKQAEVFGITHDDSCHGFNGPIHAAYPEFQYPASSNFLQSMTSLGIERPIDQACSPLGAYITTNTLHPTNQSRSSARTAYYDPIASRPNLHLLLNTQATKLIINTTTMAVTGVEFAASANAPRQAAQASSEVIVSAGSIHGPQLLQLSGIGDASYLKTLGIKAVVDLPGVGANLQDHILASTSLQVNNVSIQASALENTTFDAEQGALYYKNRTGLWTNGGPTGLPTALAFIPLSNFTSNANAILSAEPANNAGFYLAKNTSADVLNGYLKQVEVLKQLLGSYDTAAQEIMYLGGGSSLINILLHPLSRGYVLINSTNPFISPLINPRYLSNPTDISILVETLKWSRQIVQTSEMQEIGSVIQSPEANSTDGKLGTYVKRGVSTVWHASGTHAMLPRQLGGVVDPQLKVYGISNLRIVDASIFPILPGAHMMATLYAVAEKAADMIKSANKQ
ncbi:hypothetical protein N7467_000007 [Penicillium canescens]|nr:hypothetical protein N7467_000007 [Penicillium canescens]